MFYGRESALYVLGHVVDLAKSLATGSAIEQVPLPPKAQADRDATRASAQSGVPPEEAPPPDPEAAIRVQPKSVARTGITRIEWAGGSPRVARDWFPRVYVEYRHGLDWVTEAREGRAELLLLHEGESVWSARWQPTRYAPAGTYRIRIEGTRQGADGPADYKLVSSEFGVRPCRCVDPGRLRARWARGGWRVSLPAEYAPGPSAGFRLLPVWVRTGRALVLVLRDGRRIGSIQLRYHAARRTLRRRVLVQNLDGRDLPVTTREPVDRGSFKGVWRGPRGPRHATVFKLVSVRDRFGNR
jgi:hypothetical protein